LIPGQPRRPLPFHWRACLTAFITFKDGILRQVEIGVASVSGRSVRTLKWVIAAEGAASGC